MLIQEHVLIIQEHVLIRNLVPFKLEPLFLWFGTYKKEIHLILEVQGWFYVYFNTVRAMDEFKRAQKIVQIFWRESFSLGYQYYFEKTIPFLDVNKSRENRY